MYGSIMQHDNVVEICVYNRCIYIYIICVNCEGCARVESSLFLDTHPTYSYTPRDKLPSP